MRRDMVDIPKSGEKVPINMFFISRTNVRVDEDFGNSDEDFMLTQHLRAKNIVQPIIARPEGSGFGVFIGRRRYLAKKKTGVKTLTVGEEVIIKDVDDKEALDESLRENIALFRKELNPIARAQSIKKLMDTKQLGLRELGRVWNVPVSNISEWLKVLELSPKMQKAVSNGTLAYTEGIRIARMNIPMDIQEKSADVLATKGFHVFQNELFKLMGKQGKRGPQAGKYFVLRLSWDKADPQEGEICERMSKLAQVTGMTVDEMAKNIIVQHFGSSPRPQSIPPE
jgi:ParB/RepB/Spo0J family partition protein